MKTSATVSLFSQHETFCRSRIAALIAGVGIFCAVQSPAATLSWSGGGAPDGNWDNADNWGSAGIPANGDTLIFSFPQPNQINTNNIVGLTLNRIRFLGAGGGYDIRGNAFTITNHIVATNTAGANTIRNDITLAVTNQTVDVASSLTLAGALSGSVGLIKTGGGTLTLSGSSANTYSGITRAVTGTLALGKGGFDAAIPGDLEVGDLTHSATNTHLAVNQIPNTAKVTLFDGSRMDMNTRLDGIGTLVLYGANVTSSPGGYLAMFTPGLIMTVPGSTIPQISSTFRPVDPCTISNETPLIISGEVQSFGNITKLGSATLSLNGSNSFSGLLTISQGYVFVNNPFALGSTNSGVVVSNGATLAFNSGGSFGITNESLTLNGVGMPSYGALDSENSSINTWAGPVTLNAPGCTIVPYPNNSHLRIAGPISGNGGVTVWTSGGTNSSVTLEGSTDNTYTNTTTVDSGTLVLGKPDLITAVPRNLVLSGSNCVARLANDRQTSQFADVLVNAGAMFDFSTYVTYLDTLRGSGTVNFGANGWIYFGWGNGSSTFDGLFTGVGFPGETIAKTGTGTFTMNGNNTFSTGRVYIDGGKILINGSHPRPEVRVVGGTLGGSGTVGDITTPGVGTVAPGNSPGILTCSNATFDASDVLAVELTGPTAGTGYDQLNVRGACNVTGAGLSINLAFASPVAVGQEFRIINNDGADAIIGNFAGYGGGATWNQNGYTVVISYVGGTGNDVVLTLTNVPGATVGSVVTSGNGDGVIAPNECNYLGVIITNKTGTPMTGVTATLASATPGVIVTESPVPFPDVPGNGKSTNTAPFQISTTPNFVCGSNISLTLSVTSTSHGAFAVPLTIPTGAPAATPVRFDNNNTVNVPDVGFLESTNNVAVWNGGSITKVAVSLWLSAPADGDLALTLIAPNGTMIDLSSGNGGSGLHYGTGSADGSRTTFDDAAGTSITAGAPPYVGTFRPEVSLTNLIGTFPVVGNWRLRIDDSGFFGAADTLRNWSLFLYGTDCGAGSGLCELCPNVTLTSALGANSLIQSNYVTFGGGPSVCGVPKPCPGTTPLAPPLPSETFTFRNGPSDACITVTLTNISAAGGMVVAAYSGGFNPGNPDKCANYLGDLGSAPNVGQQGAFSINVASNTTFVVNVIGLSGNYKLTVSGGDCRPVLNVADIGAGKAQFDWTTAASGYQLESTNALPGATIWPAITNSPVVINSRYTVTNDVPPANQFYHLRKSLP